MAFPLLSPDLQVVLVLSWSFVDEVLHCGLCAQVQPNYRVEVQTGSNIRKMKKTESNLSVLCVFGEQNVSAASAGRDNAAVPASIAS